MPFCSTFARALTFSECVLQTCNGALYHADLSHVRFGPRARGGGGAEAVGEGEVVVECVPLEQSVVQGGRVCHG